MATKTLSMVFETSGGTTATMSLSHPKDDVTTEQVTTVMMDIVNADVFTTSKEESLVNAKSAKITTTSVEQLL